MQGLVCLYAHVIVCISLSLSMHHMYHCTDIYRNMMKYVHMTHQACDRDDARRSMHVDCWTLWRTTLYEHQSTYRHSGTPYLCCTTKLTCRTWFQCAARCQWSLMICAHALQLLHSGTLTCKDPLNTDCNNCPCWWPAVWWCLPCWLT